MNLLAALSVFLTAARASDTQVPLNIGLHRGKVISDEFSAYIRDRMRTFNISGLALGVRIYGLSCCCARTITCEAHYAELTASMSATVLYTLA
jgi:hypothetical protein